MTVSSLDSWHTLFAKSRPRLGPVRRLACLAAGEDHEERRDRRGVRPAPVQAHEHAHAHAGTWDAATVSSSRAAHLKKITVITP